jgi:capsule polysaccharide modification protein KpsS
MKSGKTFSVTYNDSSKKLALDDQKKYVVLFTNMNFDMYVLGRNPIFESMKDWIRETIKFWRENVQDYTLIIRAHPGEIKLVTASTDFVSEVVDLKEGDNIIFYDSDSDVNSYDLMNVASYVLTYSSTIGAEALLSDIPCISAGETMYQHFCTSPKSKQAYFESIVAYNEGHFPEIDQENLLFYLHYLMFIKNVEIRGFKVNRKIGKVEFDESMRDYQDLINSNSSVLKNFYNQHIDN